MHLKFLVYASDRLSCPKESVMIISRCIQAKYVRAQWILIFFFSSIIFNLISPSINMLEQKLNPTRWHQNCMLYHSSFPAEVMLDDYKSYYSNL